MSGVSVQEGYARWAPLYDHTPNPLLALEERHLQSLLPRLEGKRVLDLACGTGRWAVLLRSLGARVVGADFSAHMLQEAGKKTVLRGRLVRAECGGVPFRDGLFDLVLCSFAAAHFSDLGGVAREVARVATPSADVFVSDLHPYAQLQGWKTAFRDRQGPVEIATRNRSVHQQLAIWFAAGFRCAQSLEARLDEAERPILVQGGKGRQFDEVSCVPAIQILHLRPRVEEAVDGKRWNSHEPC